MSFSFLKRREDGKLVSPGRAMAQVWGFPGFSCTASLVAPVLLFSLCAVLLLWGACEGFPMLWLNQALSPMSQAD